MTNRCSCPQGYETIMFSLNDYEFKRFKKNIWQYNEDHMDDQIRHGYIIRKIMDAVIEYAKANPDKPIEEVDIQQLIEVNDYV